MASSLWKLFGRTVQAELSDDLTRVSATAVLSKPLQQGEFEMLAYTGGPLRVDGFPLPVIVDLSACHVPARVPALLDHDPKKPVGEIHAVEKTACQIHATGKLTGDSAERNKVQGMARDGFQWEVSCTWAVSHVERVAAGQAVQVNGQSFSGPVLVARKSELLEISFLAIGADRQATVALAAAHSQKGEPMSFADWLKSLGVDAAKISPEDTQRLHAAFANGATAVADPEKTDDVEPPPAKVSAKAKAPPTESATPGATTNTLNVGNIEYNKLVDDIASKVSATFQATATERKKIQDERPQPPAQRKEDDNAFQVMHASLMLAAGLSEKQVGSSFTEPVMNEAMSQRYRGMSIGRLAHATVVRAGLRLDPGQWNEDALQVAREADQKLSASGQSQYTLTTALGNIANKVFQGAYDSVQNTWKEFCAIKSLKNFQTHTLFRMTSDGALREVGENGQLNHMQLAESNQTLKAKTYGGVIGINRTHLINDDTGALTEMMRGLGEYAGNRIEEGVYALLLANTGSFFHANNSNLTAGAGFEFTDAQALACLEAAFEQMMTRKNVHGKRINVQFDRILLPVKRLPVGERMFSSMLLNQQTATGTPNENPHKGKYRPLASPFLSDTGLRDSDGKAFTGQSATAWYAFSNPGRLAAMNVGFLNGTERPSVSAAEWEIGRLGMSWQCYIDFAIGFGEPAAAHKFTGA